MAVLSVCQGGQSNFEQLGSGVGGGVSGQKERWPKPSKRTDEECWEPNRSLN